LTERTGEPTAGQVENLEVPPNKSQKKSNSRLILIGGITLGCLVFGALVWMFMAAQQEIKEMEPWPSQGATAKMAAKADLTDLGLKILTDQDPRYTTTAGSSIDSAVVIYTFGGGEDVRISAMKYKDSGIASQDFASLNEDFEGNYRTKVYFEFFTFGWLHLGFDGWYSNVIGDVLVDKVREGLVSHWIELATN
jgi:hypothetical protein